MRNLAAALLFVVIAPPAFAADPTISLVPIRNCNPGAMVSGGPGILWLDCDYQAFAKFNTVTGELIMVPDSRPILPGGMAAAADGSLYAATGHGIIHVAPTGESTLVTSRIASGLTLDADGNLWFLDGRTLARIAPSGARTEIPLAPDSQPYYLVFGPDHNLWFSDRTAVVRVTPGGVITPFYLPVPSSDSIVGELVSTGRDLVTIGSLFSHALRISTDGVVSDSGWGHRYAAGAPDGRLWFTTAEGFGVSDGTGEKDFIDGVSSYWADSRLLYRHDVITAAPDGIVWYSRYWTYPQPICYTFDPVPGQPPSPPQCIQPPPTPDLPNVLVRVDPLGRKKHRLGPVA